MIKVCNNCGKCNGGLSSTPCVFNRKLCVSCSEKGGQRWIRVQTNSFPSHCINSDVKVDSNPIDFEVYFNPTYADWINFAAGTQPLLDAQLCTWNKPVTSAPRAIIKNQGTFNGIVGVALTGAPLYAGLQENGQDPWNQKTGTSIKSSVDECLGDANPTNKFYHYPAYSPCIQSSSLKSSFSIQMCPSGSSCNSNTPQNYWLTGATKAISPVGIALDGHIIYGPYKDNTNTW